MDRAKLLVQIQLVLFLMVLAALFLLPSRPPDLLWVPGLLLVVGGFALARAAVAEHQRQNSPRPRALPTPNPQASLIRSGPYRCVRHPIYTGALLVGPGLALIHGHAVLWLLAGVMAAFFTYKSFYEEQLLRAAYPEYEEYMRVTGRFVPPQRRGCGAE